MPEHELASVRYIVDDVGASLDFYTQHLGFTRGQQLRRRRSPTSSAATCGCCSAARPVRAGGRCPTVGNRSPDGWNRIHLIVDDIHRRGRHAHRRRA